MNRVFAICAPSGKNLEPAKDYGELTVMLDGNENPTVAQEKLFKHLRSFTSNDYLLLIGSPVLIAIACVLAFRISHPHVKLLVWNKENYKYNLERIQC
jgi:hypothetical protein